MTGRRRPRQWDGTVVYFAGTAWDGVPGTDRHLAQALSQSVPVLFVDPAVSPVGLLRTRTAASPRVRVLGDRLAGVTPLALPGMGRAGVRRTTDPLRRCAARAAVRELGGTVRAVVAASPSDVLHTFPLAHRVFYGTDDYVAGAGLLGVSRARLVAAESRQLQAADTLAAVSPALVARWGGPDRVHLVPNGVSAEHYAGVDTAPVPAGVDLPGPVAGVVGQLSPRLDLGLLEDVAATGASLLLVGPVDPALHGEQLSRLLALPAVRWTGRRPFADLPGLLRLVDVGLTPYAGSEFNRASFPLKTLEYLAAGRGAVTTDLPASRWLDSDLVSVAADRPDFVRRTAAELARPRTPALVARRRALAAGHSWASRAEALLALLAAPVPAGSRA